jgi:hypothetical protein
VRTTGLIFRCAPRGGSYDAERARASEPGRAEIHGHRCPNRGRRTGPNFFRTISIFLLTAVRRCGMLSCG